jgi:putative Holliday junction resolvase
MKATERVNVPLQSPLSPLAESGRILAIDYGRKRLGLAVSDQLHLTAQPLATFSRAGRQNDLRRLRDLCRRQRVSRIIVGRPLLLSGAESDMSKEASRFASRLAKQLGIAVELVEERLTTWEAEQTTRPTPRRGRPQDDIAAALILRDYLEKQRAQTPLLGSSEV